MSDPISFIHAFRWSDLPARARAMTKLSLLDLIGVAAGGSVMRSSDIMRGFAAAQMGGTAPMLFDARRASPAGVALAAGMMIDALDGHDGFNPAKGHIGCPLFAAILPMCAPLSGIAMLETLAMGYEFGARASMAQHGTVADYHTSGSWGAVTGAAALSRIMGLDAATTRHALGIAEYHGPRSQMMRCIDHPTMLKDGSSWGAMTAVTSAQLAAAGFTGAPAITVEDAPAYWADLGKRWYVGEQYYKPYPVCRWAQAPIEAALSLRRAHALQSRDIATIHVETFHESIRLATNAPDSTDQAQYSTSFPVAVALVHGTLRPAHIADDALDDPETLRLSRALTMTETDHANAAFPQRRYARVALTLTNGDTLQSGWMEPRWDATAPPTEAELRQKFHDFADDIIGADRAGRIEAAIDTLETTPASHLTDLLFQLISR